MRAKRAARSKSIGRNGWEKAAEEAAERIRSGEWEGARALVYVAAYAALHERIYGVEPSELSPKERVYAAGAAGRMLVDEFDGDEGAMADFLRWTWRREKDREDYRRKTKSESSFRIGWRLQFGGSILADYRVAARRRAGS
jgi:hypothetical protein